MSEQRRTPNHVVILGGGITGLSAAFYFARKHPTVPTTLLEKSTRFGGWVHSERVEVTDNDGNRGSVLLEAGPRTIRPNAKCILELIHLLDLRSEVVYTPRASPAARNRFLHVPPAEGLQPLPYSLLSLLTLPLGRLVLRSALAEPFVPANRPPKSKPLPTSTPPDPPTTTITTTTTATTAGAVEEDEDDESVDSFLSRRFGDAFARTLGSALVHGIYAADSRLLSVRAAFPILRASEVRGKGSVVWGELGPSAWFGRGQAKDKDKDKDKDKEHEDGEETESGSVIDREWEKRLVANAALFSFKDGMETLVRALVKALQGFPNVTLRSGTAVRRVGQTTIDEDENENDSFQIYLDVKKDSEGGDADADTEAAAPLRATHVISALPLPVLDSILQPAPPATAAEVGASTTPHDNSPLLPHLRANPHSSVTVLNLVFPSPQNSTLHPPGFGYLIPRPEHGYPSSAPGPEPEADSEAEADPEPGLLGVVFDTASLPEQDDDKNGEGARFTKMTAMLGGPYPRESSSNASDAQLVAAVLRRISAHLGHALPPPVHYAVHRNEESIPTYLVDHTARIGELGQALRELWGGRMKVVGAGVGGVSVADCVKAGRQAASEVGTQMIGN